MSYPVFHLLLLVPTQEVAWLIRAKPGRSTLEFIVNLARSVWETNLTEEEGLNSDRTLEHYAWA